jgi:predicted XRE-type DNA-binding protein
MNKEKQKSLEDAGWIFEDAEDFLELTAEERAIVDLRVRLARGIRDLREKRELTQAQLAKKMNTSQPRVNKIEACAGGVSLEQLFIGWYALGGTIQVMLEAVELKPRQHAEPCRPSDPLVEYGGRPIPAKMKKMVAAKKTPAKK